jgi:hypothetical protein
MTTEVFLIDYENIQPDVSPALAIEDSLVIVFLGSGQNKLPTTLVDTMHKLGSKGQYIQIEHINKNNLDIHLVFHIGRLLSELPNAFFHIISKDHDYDPLLEHINREVNRAARWGTLSDAIERKHSPTVCKTDEKIHTEKVRTEKITLSKLQTIEHLKFVQQCIINEKNLPKTQATLLDWLRSDVFRNKLKRVEIVKIISQLQSAKLIRLKHSKVIYGAVNKIKIA